MNWTTTFIISTPTDRQTDRQSGWVPLLVVISVVVVPINWNPASVLHVGRYYSAFKYNYMPLQLASFSFSKSSLKKRQPAERQRYSKLWDECSFFLQNSCSIFASLITVMTQRYDFYLKSLFMQQIFCKSKTFRFWFWCNGKKRFLRQLLAV